WAGRPVLVDKGSKAFSKGDQSIASASHWILYFGWRIFLNPESNHGDYFLDHFDQILSTIDAFPCRFQNPVFPNRVPFNPPYQGDDGLCLSF
ncbi:MAG: hypothetical protein OXE77_10200, partial [Flavobacteriaceae bacterium]|nr:hypothetical protein [Flavobacteriaceae bacterium]